jgi:L-erythro-3,5-diaminohexanoate dehydrogenase
VSAIGLERVVSPAGVLPQAAQRLDASAEIAPYEVRVRVERLNLDAASYRQLWVAHGGDGDAIRAAVLEIVAERGKMQNPVTGSGGMLVGVVDEVGPSSPLGLRVGDRVATLVSLTLTPLVITDGLVRWDGRSEQVPCEGHAILFARSIAAVLPDDLAPELSLAVLDVCGAPALTARVVTAAAAVAPGHSALAGPAATATAPAGSAPAGSAPAGAVGEPGGAGASTSLSSAPGGAGRPGVSVAVLGGGGKSGSLSLAAARRAGATRLVGVVPTETEAAALKEAGLATEIAVVDARDPVALAAAVGEPVDVTVVCVDVPGCEHGAILATRPGGTVVFFSMATSFPAAALGAEGLAADVTMLIGNGYVPGHAELALDLVRTDPGVRMLFDARLAAD